ncbi:zinc-binding metallopeptidase family protein [Algihabitans albus]|uniref:zinc-binding metallopeptidase family protein n=1 Tax=Algihabitans albus TaxID=2164067 RepID=UPI000E5CB031|nr:putative zinc-binding peptidase [Algihabitans albus]
MKLFACQNCGQTLYFENTHCEQCGYRLGYLSNKTLLSALEQETEGRWRSLADPGDAVRFCINADFGACNWLVPAGSEDSFCGACKLNRTTPNLDVSENLLLWQRLETAKHRLVYALLRLKLPLISKLDDSARGLAFDFVAGSGTTFREGPQAITGHAQGLITINIGEADPVERERSRAAMTEPYRTLLGHFRHEVGHHYWERLVQDTPELRSFRSLFGDERQDYGAALDGHYDTGPPEDWQSSFISGYASAHPWEDFAETWSHYLHILDTLETAEAFGLSLAIPQRKQTPQRLQIDFDPYDQVIFPDLIEAWLPLTFAVNSLNQSMGQPDLYPFVLAPKVLEKLQFVHDLIRSHSLAS